MQYKPPKFQWIPDKVMNLLLGTFWILIAIALTKLALKKTGLL